VNRAGRLRHALRVLGTRAERNGDGRIGHSEAIGILPTPMASLCMKPKRACLGSPEAQACQRRDTCLTGGGSIHFWAIT